MVGSEVLKCTYICTCSRWPNQRLDDSAGQEGALHNVCESSRPKTNELVRLVWLVSAYACVRVWDTTAAKQHPSSSPSAVRRRSRSRTQQTKT
jgi:hypothetical protein